MKWRPGAEQNLVSFSMLVKSGTAALPITFHSFSSGVSHSGRARRINSAFLNFGSQRRRQSFFMPHLPLVAGQVEVAPNGNCGRISRGNVGLERRLRSGCIDGVEGGQRMQGSMAIYPADGSTARLSGGCRNRRNAETACGADSQWSAYPWLVLRPRRERRAVSLSCPDTSRNTVCEAHVACGWATCASASPPLWYCILRRGRRP